MVLTFLSLKICDVNDPAVSIMSICILYAFTGRNIKYIHPIFEDNKGLPASLSGDNLLIRV